MALIGGISYILLFLFFGGKIKAQQDLTTYEGKGESDVHSEAPPPGPMKLGGSRAIKLQAVKMEEGMT